MKRIISSAMLVIISAAAFAAEISRDQAAIAAENWLRQSPNPMNSGLPATQAAKVDTVADDDGQPLFHAVRMSGGGTVITSSDTGVEPVIAFGPEDMDVTPGSPLHALLMGDMRARRAALGEEAATAKSGRATVRAVSAASADGEETPEEKWARLLGEGDTERGGRSLRAAAAPVSIPSTVKVHPLVGTHWDQGGQDDPNDREHRNAAMSPYSAFTPCNFPAGCGPVVLAQILTYWDMFTNENGLREEYRKAIYKVPYVVAPGKTNYMERTLFCANESEGGEGADYHQKSLPFRCVEFFPEKDDQENGLDPTKWQASEFAGQITVGKLLFDCGTLLGSVYSEGGTSTSSADLWAVLKNKFHFDNATCKSIREGQITQSSALSETRKDLEKKRPVIFGLANKAELAKDPNGPGHVVIADGYGTVGSTTYYHLNMGWGGRCDAWYCPPNFDTGEQETFDVFSTIIYSVQPLFSTDPVVIPGYGTIPGTTFEVGTPPDIAMPTTGFTDDYVEIEWRPFTAGAKYTIQRNQGDSNALQYQWTTVASGISGDNGVAYKDYDARPGVKYMYKVSRNGEEMDVGLTGGIHVKSPQNLTAESVDGGIRLAWDAVEGNAGYKIYCSAPQFTEALAAQAPVEYRTESSTEERVLYFGKTCAGCYFRFVVRTIGRIGDKYYLSDMTDGKVHRFGNVGNGPVLRVVSKDEKTGKVVFQWNQVAGVDGYEIWSDEGTVASNLRNVSTYEAIQTLGTLRVYAIRTFTKDAYGNYEYSEFGPPVEVDMRPALPDFSLSGATRKVTIRILKPRANILYKVYRRTGEPTAKEICVGSVKKTTNYQYADVYDNMVTTGVTYYYFVEVVSPSDPKTVWRTDMKSIMLTSGGSGSGTWEYYTGDTTAQYSVTFDRQGGSGGTESVTVANGFPMPTIAIPTKQGFDFAGYFTEPEGVGDQYYTASGTSARNWPYEHGGTLFAHWTKKIVPLSSIAIAGPATVASGESATYTCTAKYADGSTAEVSPTWSISSGASYGSIGSDGVFTANETTVKRSVTIKAEFGGKSATKAVTITAAPAPVTLSSIAISGPATVASAGTATYTCTATYSDKTTETVAAEWSLSAGTDYGTIDPATGVFAAQSAPAQRSVTVKAVFGGKSATKTVTIAARTLSSLAISGPDEIPSLETAAYTCTATYGDGTTAAISPTWSIAAGGTYATVVKTTGAVTSKNGGETDQVATLRATSGGKTADKAITLLAKEPPRPEGDLHVDAEKGDDANDGRTWRRAKKTIQGAIDAAVDGELILVFDGVYGPIDTNGKEVEIQSVNGAEATIIDGGGASRCATLGPDTMLSGFTLENGSADNGGGVSNGIVRLCILRGNTAADNGGGACESRLENCLITGNSATNGGGAFKCSLVNCTVSGNSSVYGAVYGGSVIGSIVYDNTVQAESDGMISVPQAICKRTCAQESFKNDLYLGTSLAEQLFLALGNITANPCFADAANGDYRLLPESPCIDKGNADTVAWDVDLDGAVRVQNGAVDMGAYECHAPWQVTFDLRGNGKRSNDEISGAPADDNYYVLPNATPTRFGYRFTGWTLADGTVVESLSDLPADMRHVTLYAEWAAVYYVAFKAAMDEFIDENPGEVFAGDMEPIECVWGEPVALPDCGFTREGYAFIGWAELAEKDVAYLNRAVVKDLTRIPGATVTLYANWANVSTATFVDPAGGHVVGYGARVYSSLQAAIDAAPDHGSVIAFPGTYGPIVAEHRKGLSIWAIFGPDTARSEADLSVIDGMGASRCAFFDSFPSAADMSYLVGFHLKEGSADDGGGVRGGFIQNCLITDCHADNMGAGAYCSILYRCRVSSCWTDGGGGGAANSEIYESVIDSCTSENYGGGAYYCLLTGSTVYGNFAAAGAGVAGCTVYNSIVWENRHLYETDKKGVPKLINYANVMDGKTVIYKNSFAYSDSSPKPSGKGNLAKDPLFVDADAGDFRLQKSSPVKNKGALAYLYDMPEDFLGLPRTIGALPDMGANEIADGTPVPADYDGDGLADPAYYDPVTATLVMMRSRDGFKYVQFGEKNDTPLSLNFDGDHHADFAVYSATAKNPTFSVWTGVWRYGPYPLGEKGATPLAADFDGDGLDDPAVFQGNAKKPSFSMMLSSAPTYEESYCTMVFGTKGAKAVVGDFDGDGLADLGCYTSTASKPVFKVALSGEGWSDKAPLSVTLGAKGAEPCCGDFDGDGITDFAAYSGTAKAPLLYRMFSTSKWREVRTLPFGEKGSRAAIADWDGDGAADPAIEYRGQWWYVTRGWDVAEVPAP